MPHSVKDTSGSPSVNRSLDEDLFSSTSTAGAADAPSPSVTSSPPDPILATAGLPSESMLNTWLQEHDGTNLIITEVMHAHQVHDENELDENKLEDKANEDTVENRTDENKLVHELEDKVEDKSENKE